MPRCNWQCVSQLRKDDMAAIDLRATPIADVLRDSHIEAAVVVRKSAAEVVVEVYRYDSNDMPKPINLDRYRVWERLPPDRDFAKMVNSASTEDNANMRGFMDDHVFFAKDIVRDGHHLSELPAKVKAIIGRDGAAS